MVESILREQVRAGRLLVVGEVSLQPIERRTVLAAPVDGGIWCQATLSLRAIVVRSAAGLRVLTVDGRPLADDEWREHRADLDESPGLR